MAHLAGAVPRAELHVIDGAGHEPWCDRPDELRVLLGRLISAGA